MVRFFKAPFVCALFAIALYAVTLGGTFVYDDLAIIQDRRIADPARWGEYWTRSYNDGVDNLYRPLTSMSFAVQYWLHGQTAWPYHLVNILLHGLATGLVAQVATRLASRLDTPRARAVGWFAGLLFAAHPVHVEAVANVVGRAELLCAVGALGAIGLSLEPLTRGRVVAIWALFVLAMLSKEQGMLVPAMIGMAMWTISNAECRVSSAECPDHSVDASHSALGTRHSALPSTLFLLLAFSLAAVVVLRESVLKLKFWWAREFLDPWIQPLAMSEGWDRLLVPVTIAGRYLGLLVAPVTLRIDYGGPIVPGVFQAGDPFFWLGLVAIALWAGLLIHGWRRDRFILAGTLLFGIAYAMVGNFITIIGVNVAERLMYLPSAFFVLIVARLMAVPHRRGMTATLAIVVALFSVRAVTYAVRWNDRLAFYEYAVRVEPRAMKAILLALIENQDRGNHDAAERYARQAIALRPDYDDAWLRLAGVLMQAGRLDEAQDAIDKAQSLKPEGPAAAYQHKLDERRAATRPAR